MKELLKLLKVRRFLYVQESLLKKGVADHYQPNTKNMQVRINETSQKDESKTWHEVSVVQGIFEHIFFFCLFLKIIPLNFFSQTKEAKDICVTKKTLFLSKCFIGGLLGFLFWMPFFGFIFAETVPFLYYSIFAVLLFCISFIFIALCLTPVFLEVSGIRKFYEINFPSFVSLHWKFWRNMKLQSLLQHSQFPLFFWFFLCSCILGYSLAHQNIYWLTSLFYPISIALFLFIPRVYRFYFGFFVGIFGFYWIALSFRFQEIEPFVLFGISIENLSFVIPFVIFGIGIVYGVLFWFLLYFQNLVCRLLTLSSLFIFHPFEFNWFNLAYLSSYSIFSSSFLSMFCIGIALCLVVIQARLRFFAPFFILFAFDNNFIIQTPVLNAQIIQTYHEQGDKWQEDFEKTIIQENLNAIDEAIRQKYPIIILPETSFPVTLNMYPELYNLLLEKSKDIIIFAGAMRLQKPVYSSLYNDAVLDEDYEKKYFFKEDDSKILGIAKEKEQKIITLQNLQVTQDSYNSPEESYINTPSQEEGYYNSIFIFANKQSIVADKIVLVPFGETIPFDGFLSPIIADMFGIQFGFKRGNEAVVLDFNGLKLAIANCYEGTIDLPYKTGAKYIIMGSNNAWFYPSTQRFMQQMIVKYYARNYNTFVYHATNYTPKLIITPNNGKDAIEKKDFQNDNSF